MSNKTKTFKSDEDGTKVIVFNQLEKIKDIRVLTDDEIKNWLMSCVTTPNAETNNSGVYTLLIKHKYEDVSFDKIKVTSKLFSNINADIIFDIPDVGVVKAMCVLDKKDKNGIRITVTIHSPLNIQIEHSPKDTKQIFNIDLDKVFDFTDIVDFINTWHILIKESPYTALFDLFAINNAVTMLKYEPSSLNKIDKLLTIKDGYVIAIAIHDGKLKATRTPLL